MLEKEMEVMRLYEMEAVRGGTGSGDVEIEWGIDPDGNYYYREKGTETWTAYETLDEVVITPSGKSYNPFTDYNWLSNNGYNPYYPNENSNNSSSGSNSTGVDSTGYSTGTSIFFEPYYGGNSSEGVPVNVFYCGTTNENGEHSVSNPNSEYNSAGYNSSGYNSSGYNSAGEVNPQLTSLLNNPIVQGGITNPLFANEGPGGGLAPEVSFTVRMDENGNLYISQFNVGTAYSTEQITYLNSVANLHTHPNSNREPSISDVLNFSQNLGYASNLSASYIITVEGTVYGLLVTDKNAAINFRSNEQSSLQNIFNAVAGSSTVQADRDRALANVLQGSGITLIKQDPIKPPYSNGGFNVVFP